jgi:hypothetical protein
VVIPPENLDPHIIAGLNQTMATCRVVVRLSSHSSFLRVIGPTRVEAGLGSWGVYPTLALPVLTDRPLELKKSQLGLLVVVN